MTRPRVLVVDDDDLVIRTLRRALERNGFEVECATDGDAAIALLERIPFDVMLLDLNLPPTNGWRVLEARKGLAHRPLTFIITGEDERQVALRAMRLGASDVIGKPVVSAALSERLHQALATSTGRHRALATSAALHRLPLESAVHAKFPTFESAAVREVYRLAERVAATPNASALILGESGVGKEVLANFIHDQSERRGQPHIRVNLAAIAPSIMEAELFGSVRGAFTGADRERIGYFSAANGGTLMLDEIGELDIALQPKLLRVLEERKFFPVGSSVERSVDVRVLCATNREPREAIVEGRLRNDLFYRVATVILRIPPLRERREDILPLARSFLMATAETVGRRGITLAPETEQHLLDYAWPGNVRELRNVVERALIVSRTDSILPRDLGLEAVGERVLPSAPSSHRENTEAVGDLVRRRQVLVASLERDRILAALAANGGSTTRAAAQLGVSRSTLWLKMKKYSISRPSHG